LTIEPALASELDLAALGVRASALTELGRLGEARALLDRARSLERQSHGKLSPFWTDPAERGWLLASGRADEALAAFRTIDAAQPPVPGTAASVSALAEAARLALETGDAAAAQAQAMQALSAINAGGVADYQRDYEARATLVIGRALLGQRRAAEALPVLEKAVELHRAEYDPDHSPAVAEAWLALAEARRALGDSRAADAQEQARRIRTGSTTRP
jgi:serine/threonine-protein kinase